MAVGRNQKRGSSIREEKGVNREEAASIIGNQKIEIASDELSLPWPTSIKNMTALRIAKSVVPGFCQGT